MRAVLLLVLVVACRYAPGNLVPDAHDIDADTRPREMRGVWVTRFAYTTQADLEGIIDRAAAAHFNAVFVQIRGEADAYYKSSFEPWAKRLTGVLGRDPGWDPLQVAIDRAHAHGMELHAYFNVFTAWSVSSVVPAAEGPNQHVLVDHPSWLAVDSTGDNHDSEYRWLAPGNPNVRTHILAVARDLLWKYDVDGLHLDRIRAPGPDYSRDAASMTIYNGMGLSWEDFMRTEVDQMVADIHASLVEIRPAAKLSASVWGIYQRLPDCSTSEGYSMYYQDSLGWLAQGTIDAIAPMMYWPIEAGACTDWGALLDGFVGKRSGRQIWAGMHALDGSAWDFAKVSARIDRSRADGADGTIVFASSYLDEDPVRWSAFSDGPYAEPAVVPEMAWK